MKIAYFGSPDFSAKLLEEISKHHTISCVVSNPDKISDRSRVPKPTPVSEHAMKNNWLLFRPEKLNDKKFLEEFSSIPIDIGVIFSYGKIIPQEVLNIPKNGFINLHGSLLPDLRGASPIQTAIIKGYKKSGWTVQLVSKEMDGGDILLQKEFEILENETMGEVLERVLPDGIEAVLSVLNNFDYYKFNSKKQNPELATYCYKINSEMSYINWKDSSLNIHNFVRALNPNPIAKTKLLNKEKNEIVHPIKIYRTQLLKDSDFLNTYSYREIGEIQISKVNKKNYLFVKTKDNWIEILEIQYPNKKILFAHDFINGNFIQNGDIFI